MSDPNIRANYQQNHLHGGGKLGGFVRAMERGGKDSKLRKKQPIKVKLQNQKFALEQQVAHLKMLKAQGITHIIPPGEPKPHYTYPQPQQSVNPSPPKPPVHIRFTSWYHVQIRPVQVIVAIAIIACVIFVSSAATAGIAQDVQEAPSSNTDTAHSSLPTSTPTLPAYLTESLTFHGDISGKLTKGINPQPLTQEDPIPTQSDTLSDPVPTSTQCAAVTSSNNGYYYLALIVGKVGTMRYAITIEVDENNPDYKKPETELHIGYRDGTYSITAYEVGGQQRAWYQGYGPSMQDSLVGLHAGWTSGTVDAWMATDDEEHGATTGGLHIKGSWRCG